LGVAGLPLAAPRIERARRPRLETAQRAAPMLICNASPFTSLPSRAARWLSVAWLCALAACALLALAPAASARFVEHDSIADFKKYFRQYKDTPSRVEAVRSLEGIEEAAVVETLAPILKLPEPDVVLAVVTVLSKFKTEAPQQAVYAALAASSDEAIRSGLMQAATLGKYKGGAETLLKLLTDKAWEVRRRSVEALCAAPPPGVEPLLLPLASDPEPAVRCAALDGLAALKSQSVLEPARAALGDAVWQVRASAVGALKRVRHRDSIEPLIARLALEEGRLVADIGDALNEITGRSFGTRVEGWQQFWGQYKDRFQIPTDEELAKLRERQKAEAAKYKPQGGTTTYHGIDTPSRRVVFVIDCSGSMETMVVEKERFQDGGYPSFQRIDIVKTELVRTIEKLEPYVEFNIIAFATGVKPWKKELVKANVLNKSAAMDWVKKLEAIGGSSKEDLAQAGLSSSANLEAGKTNTHGALMAALDAGGRGTKDKNYACAVDTIFFLSDGRPTVGDYVDPKDVLREVRNANALRKVVLHTIAIGEFQKDFMEQLAREHGGVFVDLGR
jgi:HEAT repeat protein